MLKDDIRRFPLDVLDRGQVQCLNCSASLKIQLCYHGPERTALYNAIGHRSEPSGVFYVGDLGKCQVAVGVRVEQEEVSDLERAPGILYIGRCHQCHHAPEYLLGLQYGQH